MTEYPRPVRPFPSLVADPSAGAVRRATVALLASAGVPSADVDAELLIAFVSGLDRAQLQTAIVLGRPLDPAALDALGEVVSRRMAREPLQHITGVAAFRRIELAVGPGVFVPRPETEVLVQLGLDELERLEHAGGSVAAAAGGPVVVDLGTGSGAIALSVATESPASRVWAVEASVEAFLWAEGNRRRLGLDNATVVRGDLGDALDELDGTVDLVLSNPPYVPDDAIPRDPEVRLHDPELALYGGPDGLDVVRVLAVRGAELLKPGRLLAIEHGERQGEQIRELLTAAGWSEATTIPDLSGRDRVTHARRHG
ncbi:peptide chain release factor N(5)-glutamine methyltransferase [Mycetocola reblochoni]|nr:peptide chain release factor N(5)-glutamine methyltransferase [Mycetocola reblochoni]RLP70391.1 peptide chain release factor N(5)-glutamine methyltransferase [Mycetocola reblochoni]